MALRATPPAVGLVLRSTPAHEHDARSDRFDSRIMHRSVPSSLTRDVVQLDASDAALSRALGVPVEQVAAEWFTSRTPIADPRRRVAAAARMRRRPTPQRALQEYHDHARALRARLAELADAEGSGRSTEDDRRRNPGRRYGEDAGGERRPKGVVAAKARLAPTLAATDMPPPGGPEKAGPGPSLDAANYGLYFKLRREVLSRFGICG